MHKKCRKICTIQYNILNLPQIIQFCNGNSIVNTYNAEGVKLSSTYYTLPEAVAVPVGDVLNPDTLPQAPRTMTVQYMGNLEKTIINDSVSYTLHIPEGYISIDSLNWSVSWNYFRSDHLGNNVAVWNATADTTVQRMFYYPSGLPMPISIGQSAQPYKYNGKEYDEMHGYDVYDYGFRGYYATIARFTSIDPLCERTPWQSPYCYASNNFTGEIDWMGLFGSGGIVSGSYGTCQWVAVDSEGIVQGWGTDEGDFHVYLVDEDWDKTYEGLSSYQIIGWEILGTSNEERPHYKIGEKTYYVKSITTINLAGSYVTVNGSIVLMYGNEQVNTKRTINNNKEAVLHYYLGHGEAILNGDIATWNFMLTSQYREIFTNIANGSLYGVGNINMRWRGPQFHIGRTFYSYQVSGNLVFIGFAVDDGFWDPRFITEKYYEKQGIDATDGKGPNLELGGTPYDYIPTVIIVKL